MHNASQSTKASAVQVGIPTRLAQATRKAVPLLTMMTLVLSSAASSAQSCSQIVNERGSIKAQARWLANNNPGSAIVFGSCVAAGANAYEQRGDTAEAMSAVSVCAGLGCTLTDSYTNCIGVNLQLFALVLKDHQLKNKHARDC